MIKVLNTKNNEIKEYNYNDAIKEFECDSFHDKYCLKSEYNECLSQLEDEDDKKEYIEYWSNSYRYIIENKTEYIKEMIEYDEWTSPSGIKPVYKVISNNMGGKRPNAGRKKGSVKSEEQKTKKHTIAVTDKEYATYLKNGGAKWLRTLLQEEQ